ncbi:MAG: hypothetical protein M1831_004896 [Alyxoria varia]|nr:MAG: hypothetical protein M1831_004896 [Alyxoria varia]
MSAEGGANFEGYVDPSFPNPGDDGDAAIIIYGYTPSLALGVLGVILFFFSLLLHLAQLFRHRTYYFGVPLAIGCAFETVGYIMRLLSSQEDPYRIVFFVVQYFFIVVAPVFFSAGIYAVLSAMIRKLGAQYSPILGPKAILATFITADVVATVVQVAGAALIGVAESNREDPTTPNNILLAGLAVQAFSFLVFLILLGVFLWKAKDLLKSGSAGQIIEEDRGEVAIIKKVPAIFFIAASLLVYLRTTFRLAETIQGLGSDLQTHEVYFGCLEYMPVVLAVWLLAYPSHPGEWVGRGRMRGLAKA